MHAGLILIAICMIVCGHLTKPKVVVLNMLEAGDVTVVTTVAIKNVPICTVIMA